MHRWILYWYSYLATSCFRLCYTFTITRMLVSLRLLPDNMLSVFSPSIGSTLPLQQISYLLQDEHFSRKLQAIVSRLCKYKQICLHGPKYSDYNLFKNPTLQDNLLCVNTSISINRRKLADISIGSPKAGFLHSFCTCTVCWHKCPPTRHTHTYSLDSSWTGPLQRICFKFKVLKNEVQHNNGNCGTQQTMDIHLQGAAKRDKTAIEQDECVTYSSLLPM